MEKSGHRYVIQYFYLKGIGPTNIIVEQDSTLGESAPSFTTVKYWVAEFKLGRTSCKGDHRSGRPNKMTTPEMVKKIHKELLDDRRLKVRELVDILGISKIAVHRILYETLDMRESCVQDGCRVCSHSSKNSVVKMFQSSVQRNSTATKQNFCAVS
ncbi:mariner transposase [Trichonephila clavipes]|nr:mariner transposase [Trichonephila clavipes]